MRFPFPVLAGLALAALVAAILPAAAPAQTATAESCARIANPDERLSCFDSLFVQAQPPVRVSQWNVSSQTSSLDDTRRVILRLNSTETLRPRFGQGQRGTLIIRCEENTTSLYVIFGGHFMSDIQGGGRVDYRIDDRRPAHVTMRSSNDNSALGFWRGGESIPFIRQLFGADQLYLRATPFSESRLEMTFPISGLEEAIAPLREACNW